MEQGPDRDPAELESHAVGVAALAAGISQDQALAALDAAGVLIRRAHTLRTVAAMQQLIRNAPAGDATRVAFEKVIASMLRAVDLA